MSNGKFTSHQPILRGQKSFSFVSISGQKFSICLNALVLVLLGHHFWHPPSTIFMIAHLILKSRIRPFDNQKPLFKIILRHSWIFMNFTFKMFLLLVRNLKSSTNCLFIMNFIRPPQSLLHYLLIFLQTCNRCLVFHNFSDVLFSKLRPLNAKKENCVDLEHTRLDR